jgi:hypothetical protein
MMAHSFYVDDQHRGGGASIFLKYLQLGCHYPLFVSSANTTVAEMWRKLGGHPVGNSDNETLGVLRWPPLLAEIVYRKTASDRMAQITAALALPWSRARRRLLSGTVEGKLVPLRSPEEAALVCAEHSSEKITSRRDVRFLKWRYFSRAEPTPQLFSLRPHDGAKQFMVGVRLQNRGYKQQIRALHVLDIWGEADPKSYPAIAACLWREYREQIDVLVFRCLNPMQQEALTTKGFRVHPLAAPIAWCIDKFALLPTKSWYFVPADGDMFL